MDVKEICIEYKISECPSGRLTLQTQEFVQSENWLQVQFKMTFRENPDFHVKYFIILPLFCSVLLQVTLHTCTV